MAIEYKIIANTPEDCKKQIVEYLNYVANEHSIHARIAHKKTTAKQFLLRAECVKALANFVENIKIIPNV